MSQDTCEWIPAAEMCEQDMFDGTCWESARSSWIYMEMEPKPHRPESLPQADASGIPGEMSLAANLDDMWRPVEERSLEFVEGQTEADIEEDGDYAEICEDPCSDSVGKDPFILKTGAPARRSVSLDSYPLPKKCLLKLSESFPHRSRPLTSPETHTPRTSPDPYTSRPLTSPDPYRSRPSPDPPRPLVQTDSVMSVCATVSAATSCGSLYRIPAKVRKLSSNSTWSTISTKHLFPTAHPADALKAPSSQMPKLLRDVFYYLWCENPDRDPFNTFSVSETDLTAAISHLEQQLSTRIRHQDEKSRASLFSTFISSHTSEPVSSLISSQSEPVPESDDDVSVGPAHNLPFRLQFIMESYCNIYMLR